MDLPERYVCLDFLIDTNRINARRGLKSMNILERWHDSDVISIEMAEVAQDEVAESGDSNRTEKAYTYTATQTLADSSEERMLLNQIKAILVPHGLKTKNELNDIEIVFNAYKYYCILITDDGGSRRQPGGILGNRDRLAALGIQVMHDYEAVELVKQKIIKRDLLARKIASAERKPLPDWVDVDLAVAGKLE
jgi:hypothetical protein